ncbi:MAG: molybdenum cofactor biosynthesis protein MoaE [Desulfurococcales archaeon]|nr:molybdenum cofactor biosynthesis protein MoaE [Desulfurococcales archaeon]
MSGKNMSMCRISVKLYAVLRDLVGTSNVDLVLDSDPKKSLILQSLWEKFPKLAETYGSPNELVIITGGKPISKDESIPCGSEVHILPPAAGGDLRVHATLIQDEADLNQIARVLENEDMGALLLFVGTVKSVVDGHRVSLLHYEAHENLVDVLRKIAIEVGEKHGLAGVYVAHAVGDRRPGDITFVAAVKSYSRLNGFPALRELVERVKREAPIWKKEYRDDGIYWITGAKRVRVDV